MHVSKDDELYLRNIVENSKLPTQEIHNQEQQRSQVPSHNSSIVRQDNGCRTPYQDISIPSLTYNRTLGQNRFIPPPISNQPPVSPKPTPRMPPPLPPNSENQNQNASIPIPPPLPSNFPNQNENSSIPPPPLPIVLPEPITNEPPTTTSNTEPSWLDDIRGFKAANLKVCDIIIL
jgi:hypothetical protein